MLDPLAESGFSIMIKGIVFFEEYFDFMDDMTPEEFYEFMGLIRDLRFNGVDTKPEEVNNKVVRLAWRSVRPSVLKSARNARDYEGNKGQKPKQGQEEQVDNSIPTCDISNDNKEKAKEETKEETMVYKLSSKPKVDENNGYFKEWLLMMKNNPEDKKTFSRWWQFYRNKDDAVEDLNNRLQIEVNYA